MSRSEQKSIPGIPQGPLFQAVKEGPAAIPPKAEFADNRELRMVDALCAHLDWLHENLKKPVEIAIATGYFNPQGFALLADRLTRLERVRLLLGAEPLPPPAIPLRMPGAPRGEKFELEIVSRELSRNESGLARDRDVIPFAPEDDRTLHSLIDFLESGKIEVRRYEKAFLHGKAFIFASDEGVISGSSNFTAAGLTSNLELNLGRYDPTPVKKVSNWFETLWNDAVPYDLASVYEARFEPYEPYLVFLRVLWERYKEELEQEADQGRIHLTTFQSDGIFRAKRIAEKYNGVLVADGVGLGKTFIGGELIRQTIEDRRQRALLIAPAALRDGPWERFRVAHSMYMETVSYEQLVADSRLGGGTVVLKQDPNEYALVVVDEAQAFRNPETQRARALRLLLQGKPPKTLILMTATPVNNSLWDLYYLLTYFVRHDATFSEQGIRSLRETISDTVKLDPDTLSPDALFDILDATTVRRTRHFVQRYYPNDRVTDSRGREIPVVFPKPHVRQIDYSLDDALPGFFEEFEQALAPEKGDPELSLARYSPGRYKAGNHGDDRDEALLGLLRSGLLKRFESSAYAFAKTAETMARAHDVFLDGLEEGVILTAEGIADWEQTDSDEAFEELVRQSGSMNAKGYNLKDLRVDVEADRDLLRRFAKRANELKPQDDPKLKALIEELLKIDIQASKEGFDDADKCNRR